ncbi:hypothetical protein SAY86_006519 [Trapa natans]|uniref:Uncharacterized protein n=1 Tax=Trapa natans TaxID=22666 RepID=A0AAN7L4N9_TRANT|nr:hypothetical protein SAY86_006519 [Trapa natans]
MCLPARFLFCLCATLFISCLLCCSPATTLSSSKGISSSLISAFSSLTWLLLKGSAYLLMFLIKALQLLTRCLHCGMICIAEGIRSLAWWLLHKFLELVESAASMLIDYMKEQIPNIASALNTAFDFLMERIKGSIECLRKIVPEITKDLMDTLMGMLQNLWTNYLEAVKHVLEKEK